MSMSGGVSGSIGSQQQPSPEDLAATAANTNMKDVLGLKRDTIDTPFTKLGGEHNLWDYKASPGRPTLHPLVTVRGAGSEEAKADDSWKNLYNQLAERLGPEIQERLEEENKIPFSSKDFIYVVLDNLLTALAKAIVWLDTASAIVDPASVQAVKAQENAAMPTTFWHEMSGEVKSLLASVGPYLSRENPLYFDLNVNMLKQIAVAIRSMGKTYDENVTEKGIDPQTRSVLIAQNMALLGDQFKKADFGSDLSIIRHTWDIMTTVAAAKSLEAGPSSLMLGLAFATSGIYSSNSQSGIIGPALENIINQLSGGLVSAFVPDATQGGKVLLREIITAALIGCIGASSIIAQTGLGSSGAVELDSAAAKALSFDLVMRLVNSTGVLNTFFENIAGSIGAKGESANMLANTLSVAFMTMMLVYGGNIQGETGSLIHSLNEALQTNISSISEVISQNMDADQTSSVDVALQQAKLALEDQDPSAFLGAITNLFEQMGISSTQLNQDLAQITKTTSLIQSSFAEGMWNQTKLTGIIQAA